MNTNPPQFDWVAFRLGRLGDVALATGVLAHFAFRRKQRFAFIVRKAFAPLLEHNPAVSRIIALDDAELTLPAFTAFCRKTAAGHAGLGLLDLHGTPRSRLLSLFWKGEVRRYAKMSMQRRLFLASGGHLFPGILRAVTVPQRYAAAFGTPPPPDYLLPVVYLTAEERTTARSMLDELLGPGARPVALHPFAAHELKTWSERRWRELAELLGEAGIPWIALGRDAQPSPFEGMRQDLCNRTSLRESCALIAESQALVSGDSGPMHLGTAVGTPVLALFGPTTREWGFYPSGPRDMVLELPLPCRPCSLHGKKPCPRGGDCLEGISPRQAFRVLADTMLTPPSRP